MKIRASIGTAAALGLEKVRVFVKPTTAYLMLYSEDHCQSNCKFCPQACECSGKTNRLSRVFWPKFEVSEIINRIKTVDSGFKRICIQTVRFEHSTKDLFAILQEFNNHSLKIPMTVCSYPVSKDEFQKMKDLGVTRVGISFDCATPELFDEIKGRNRGVAISWDSLEQTIDEAIDVFGNRFISTHLIIGLGETEKQSVEFLQYFHEKKVTIGLFAFTPIRGTELEHHPQPDMATYRRVQLARYLISRDISSLAKMSFSKTGEIVSFGIDSIEMKKAISEGIPFKTSGCPHCNRPFYNESPGKELYNFPRELHEKELSEVASYFTTFFE